MRMVSGVVQMNLQHVSNYKPVLAEKLTEAHCDDINIIWSLLQLTGGDIVLPWAEYMWYVCDQI